MLNPLFLIKKLLLRRRYKKSLRRDRTLGFKVGNAMQMLAALDAAGIAYAVLRWPDEVVNIDIRNAQEEQKSDVDVLVKVDSWKRIFEASCHLLAPHGTRFDIYAANGLKGLSFRGFPYYPPVMADWLLASRIKNDQGFYQLSGEPYITSLAYHLIYHKWEQSGLAFRGEELPHKDNRYVERLVLEAEKQGVALPQDISVVGLHDWLSAKGLSMPFDLLIRYREEGEYRQRLISLELDRLKKNYSESSQYRFVFLLRDDIEGDAREAFIIQLLRDKFVVEREVAIPIEKRAEVSWRLRGGSWFEDHLKRVTLPYKIVVCIDTAPVRQETPDPAYPLVDNANFYYKTYIRDQVEKAFNTKSNSIHGTDCLMETEYVFSVFREAGVL